MIFQPLLTYERNGLTENTFFGAVSIYNENKIVFEVGRNPLVYARSLLKPFYTRAYANLLYNLNNKQKAISLSSHNGSKKHVEVAYSLLGEVGEKFLLTPKSGPLISEDGDQRNPSKWIHNSSGHHAGIVLGLIKSEISPINYTHKSHKVFLNFKEEIYKAMGDGYRLEKLARDGDGLPTLAMKIADIAKAYSYLATCRDQDWVWQAFSEEPYYIGGAGRLDSAINKLGKGDLIAKEGADGLLAVSSKTGWAFTIKMAHGWDTLPTWAVAREILNKLGYNLLALENPKGQKIVLSHQIESFRTL